MAIFAAKGCFSERSGLNGRAADAMIVAVQSAIGANSMSIYEQVLAFIHRPEPESFERVALDVFRHQFETIAAYGHYCEGLGVEPDVRRQR